MKRASLKDLAVGLGVIALVLIMLYVMVAPWMLGSGADLNTTYGKRRARARTSVNGTSVFADMFAQRGARVTSWYQLSPRLRRSQVIVWTPDSFELPDADAITYLEDEWLSLDDGPRTLIYVGRDLDAAVDYWSTQAAGSQGADYLKARRERAHEQSRHAYERALTGKKTESSWFSLASQQQFATVRPDQGPWASDIDPDAMAVEVATHLELPERKANAEFKHEVLLGSDQTPLIVRVTNELYWPDSQVLVLVNGFSVLNLPLVNREHRKVAGKLIDACQDPSRVTFLETGASGPRISSQDTRAYSGFEALTVWPINSILLHLIVAGILFCLMVFPIFGRPRELVKDTPSDFGKHIRAMADLLALVGDRQAAMELVQQYRALTPERSGALGRGVPEDVATEGNPFKSIGTAKHE